MAKRKKPLVPVWDDVWKRFKANERLNPLERFVLDNEPEGVHERKFRGGLRAALRYVLSANEGDLK